jgi:hypothetical protein
VGKEIRKNGGRKMQARPTLRNVESNPTTNDLSLAGIEVATFGQFR